MNDGEEEGPRMKHLRASFTKILQNGAKQCGRREIIEHCFPFNLDNQQLSLLADLLQANLASVQERLEEPFGKLVSDGLAAKLNQIDQWMKEQSPSKLSATSSSASDLPPEDLLNLHLVSAKRQQLERLQERLTELQSRNEARQRSIQERQARNTERIEGIRRTKDSFESAICMIDQFGIAEMEAMLDRIVHQDPTVPAMVLPNHNASPRARRRVKPVVISHIGLPIRPQYRSGIDSPDSGGFDRLFKEKLKLSESGVIPKDFSFSFIAWRKYYRSDHPIWPIKILPALVKIITVALRISKAKEAEEFLSFALQVIQSCGGDVARLMPRLWQQILGHVNPTDTDPISRALLRLRGNKTNNKSALFGAKDHLESTIIPYNDRRDSRNNKISQRNTNSNQQHLQVTNQQKLRDLFLHYVHATTPQAQTGFDGSSRRPASADPGEMPRRILGQLRRDNYTWFALFLVDFYEGTNTNQSCDRMLRLEERLNLPSPVNTVRRFLLAADSGRLEAAVMEECLSRILAIQADLIDGIGCVGGHKAVDRMAQLAQLMAGVVEDGIILSHDRSSGSLIARMTRCAWNDHLLGHLKEFIKAGALLTALPWIRHLLDPKIIKEALVECQTNQSTFPIDSNLVAQVLIAADFVPEGCWKIPPPPPSFGLIDAELVAQRHSLTYANLLKDQLGPAATAAAPAKPAAVKGEGFARKIRPIPAVVSEEQKEQLQDDDKNDSVDPLDPVQKQLRQWLWWQFPTFYDQIRSLLRYFVCENGSSAAATSIPAIIPHLLPAIMREEEGAMAGLFTALALEMLEEEESE